MKKLQLIFLMLMIVSCSGEKETNLKITGEIKELKEGTIHLQQFQDSVFVSIDSVVVNGDSNFVFDMNIEEPQVLYLYLDKVDNNISEDRFPFFAEKGEMNIVTSLRKFGVDPTITGSENQKKLEEYQKMIQRFNEQNLTLLKENLDAQISGNDSLFQQKSNQLNKLKERKYLYTINFAITNKDKELAPYLALSDVYDANVKYLDTVYNSLTPQIQESLYGEELKKFIEERERLETDTSAVAE
ncbi:MAG TPA: DUF4369 domain-containing protein [Salinimicrobium sp.]|nr:DUF4369 domain-containing protein [Salinimicrobium sp.]